VEQVSNLITHKLKKLAEAEDDHSLQSKRKAITTLLPYAVWQERDGRPEMLDAFLHPARASREKQLTWNRTEQATATLLSEGTPRAIVLVLPHVLWDQLADGGDLVKRWATAASVISYTNEVGQSVADMLLQIASVDMLVPSIPVDIWSWLTKRPPLPLNCLGRYVGTHSNVVKAVRALKDVEVLTSYFLLVWSEWDDLRDHRGFGQMCASLREDLSGVGMGDYRMELIQLLDHILKQLDRGVGHLKQHNPELGKYDLWKMKRRYKQLRELLLEAEKRTSFSVTAFPHTDSGINTCGLPRRSCVLLPSHACSFPYGTACLSRSSPPTSFLEASMSPCFAVDAFPFFPHTLATLVMRVSSPPHRYVTILIIPRQLDRFEIVISCFNFK